MLSDAPTRAKIRSTDRDLRLARRDEGARLRHDADQRGLPQVGRLAAHVRSGEDHELRARPIQQDVVRDERFTGGGGAPLDDRVAGVEHRHLVAVVHVRLRVVVDRRRFGERGEGIERGHRPCGRLDPRRLDGNGGAQLIEQLQLALDDPLVRAEDPLLVFLERGRDVTLAAGNRLLPMVIWRDRVEVRLRDLDVVAEDAVVPHLQRRDPGSRALSLLHLRDDLLAGSARRPKLVERSVEAVADVTALARERRRLVDERSVDAVPHVGELVELGDQAADERRLALGQHRLDAGDGGNRILQGDVVARAGRAEHDTRDQPLQVLNRFDRVAEPAAIGRAERELFDRVESIADAIERQQRTQQPGAQRPAADGGDRAIELREQRPVPPSLGALQDLEVLERRGIDDQGVGSLAVAERADVGEVDLLRRLQVVDEGAGRRDGRRPAIEAEPFEPGDAQLIEERAPGRLGVECPAVDRCDQGCRPPRPRESDRRRRR